MSYSIRFTPLARRDLDSVWDEVYEASRDVETTERYISELLDQIRSKKEYPLSGIPLEYRGLFTGFYSVNFKKYKVFYRVKDDRIEVIRIIMIKKDYMYILFGE